MNDPAARWTAVRRGLLGLDLEVALRAALAAIVPLLVLLAIGRPEWAAYGAFGGMTAIFGRGEPYRVRARTVAVAAAGLVGSVALGTAIAVAGSPVAAQAVALAAVLVVGTLAVQVARLGPPTTLFFVFALLVTAAAPTPPGEYAVRLGVALASAAFAWLVSMSGWMLRRAAAARGADPFKTLPRDVAVRPAALRDPAVLRNIVQLLGATALAWTLASLIAGATGLGHSYWAVVSAVAVIPPPGAAHSVVRAWHRTIGTAGGVVITALVLWPSPPVLVLVLVVGLAQFGAEVLVGRHYGAALLVITPLALVVSQLAHPGAVAPLLVDRLVETAIGAAAGVVFVLAARWTARRGRD